jgi:hypothetical protein
MPLTTTERVAGRILLDRSCLLLLSAVSGSQEDGEKSPDADQRYSDESDKDNRFGCSDGVGHTPRAFRGNATDHTRVNRLLVFRTGGVVLSIVAGTALHLGRQRGVGAWESLWAEDGSVFFTDAHRDFDGTFFTQNGGYIHVVPRIIAGAAVLLPVDWAAAVFAVAGSAVVALVAVFVYFASREAIGSSGARLGLSTAVLLLPVAGAELYANALNLHFYLLFACFWALIWQSETRAAMAARSAVVLSATLSDPVAALLLPLAIVAPIARRSVRALAVSGAFFGGLIVQVILMRGGESPERNWAFRLSDLPDIFSLRVTGGLLVGDRFLDDLWLAYGRTFSYAALLAVSLVVVYLLLRSSRPATAFALIALGYAGLFFCVQLVGRGTGGMDPEPGSFNLNGARYVLLPFLLTLAAVLALLDNPRLRSGRTRLVEKGMLLWLVAVIAVNYPLGPNTRSEGPRWNDELTKARQGCLNGETRIARILVAPSPPEVWFARLPCSKL